MINRAIAPKFGKVWLDTHVYSHYGHIYDGKIKPGKSIQDIMYNVIPYAINDRNGHSRPAGYIWAYSDIFPKPSHWCELGNIYYDGATMIRQYRPLTDKDFAQAPASVEKTTRELCADFDQISDHLYKMHTGQLKKPRFWQKHNPFRHWYRPSLRALIPVKKRKDPDPFGNYFL